MNCQEVRDNIYAYCDGTLPPVLEGDICLHITLCASCRQNYRLTMSETSVLQDTQDIPSLSPSFTSQVLSSLAAKSPQAGQNALPPPGHKVPVPFRPKAWQSVSVAAAAVIIALFLYAPHLSKVGDEVDVAINNSSLNQPEHISPGESAPAPTPTSPVKTITPPVAKGEAPKQELSSPIVAEVQPGPGSEVLSSPSVNKAVTSADGVADRAFSAGQLESEGLVAAPPIVSSSFSPLNVPPVFKLVAVDNRGLGQTVYNYVSSDQMQSLRLIVVAAANIPNQEIRGFPTRIFQVGDHQITVTFSGNLPAPDLEQLANTIIFADAAETNTD